MAVFSHRRAPTTKVDRPELMPRFQAEHGHPPSQRELPALQGQATLRTCAKQGWRGRLGRSSPKLAREGDKEADADLCRAG